MENWIRFPQKVGELLFDQLNDSPLFEVDCWRITTQGTGSKMHKTLRLKPKHFFNKVKTAPCSTKGPPFPAVREP